MLWCLCMQVACKLVLQGEVGYQEWWRMLCQAVSANGTALVDISKTPPESAPGAGLQRHNVHPKLRKSSDSNISDIVRLQCPDSDQHGWGPPMIVASLERVQSGTIGEAVVSLGITGLYVTIVFGIGRFVRLSIANMRMRIPYQDLPDVSHLWTLCSDITVAREEGEFLLEEQLFYTLINLYRSPQVLFELTKKDL